MPEPPQACRCPALYTDRTFLVQARVANHQLKKLLKRKGGIAPKAGDKDYKWYCRYCKACKGYY